MWGHGCEFTPIPTRITVEVVARINAVREHQVKLQEPGRTSDESDLLLAHTLGPYPYLMGNEFGALPDFFAQPLGSSGGLPLFGKGVDFYWPLLARCGYAKNLQRRYEKSYDQLNQWHKDCRRVLKALAPDI